MKSGLVLFIVVATIILVWTSKVVKTESTSSEDDATDKEMVTCGSIIKLKNLMTSGRLHSHNVNYGTGSKQQSVTGFPEADDANSLWIIESGFGEKPCEQGSPIRADQIVRFRHAATNK